MMIYGCSLYYEPGCQDFPNKCVNCGAFVDRRKKEIKSMKKPDFKVRLLNEYKYLRGNIQRLDKFIKEHDNGRSNLISDEELHLMKTQLYYMRGYAKQVFARLEYHHIVPDDYINDFIPVHRSHLEAQI